MTEKEIIWLKALKEITCQLEKFRCKYFLDTGTLLGAVRENRFIPWDNDIDLAVVDSNNSYEVIKSICQYMYKLGYNVTATIDEIDIFDTTGMLDLGVKFYHVDNDFYWAKLGKVEGSPMCHSIYMSLSRSIIYKKGYSSYALKARVSSLFKMMSFVMPKYIVKLFLRKAKVKSNIISIPKDLLSDFVGYTFYDYVFKIPLKKEQYLEWRYGKTWKTPNSSYDFTEDDMAISK